MRIILKENGEKEKRSMKEKRGFLLKIGKGKKDNINNTITKRTEKEIGGKSDRGLKGKRGAKVNIERVNGRKDNIRKRKER